MAEFIEAVGDVAGRAEHDAESKAAALTRLNELATSCPPDWREQTAVKIKLGIAYGSLGRYEDACNHLESALAGEAGESTTTFAAVEQLANFEVRIADQKIDEARRVVRITVDCDEAQKWYQSAVDRLEALLAVAETAERYNLLGGTYRRTARATRDPHEAQDALTKARQTTPTPTN